MKRESYLYIHFFDPTELVFFFRGGAITEVEEFGRYTNFGITWSFASEVWYDATIWTILQFVWIKNSFKKGHFCFPYKTHRGLWYELSSLPYSCYHKMTEKETYFSQNKREETVHLNQITAAHHAYPRLNYDIKSVRHRPGKGWWKVAWLGKRKPFCLQGTASLKSSCLLLHSCHEIHVIPLSMSLQFWKSSGAGTQKSQGCRAWKSLCSLECSNCNRA